MKYKPPCFTDTNSVICKIIVGTGKGPPSDEGAVSEADWGRERLPLSQPVRLTAPLTRGAFGGAAEKEKDIL